MENVAPKKFCDIKPALSTFIHQYKCKITTVKRESSKFEAKYATWLDGIVSFKLIKNADPQKNILVEGQKSPLMNLQCDHGTEKFVKLWICTLLMKYYMQLQSH